MPSSKISTVPGAVLAFRDLAVERRVLERVILDVHGERPRARARAARPSARPTTRARRSARAGSRSAGVRASWRCTTKIGFLPRLLRAERLGRLLGVALAAVLAEAHLGSFTRLGGLLLRAAAVSLLLRRGDRLAQRLHQVDDLAALLLCRLGQRLALRLLLQQVEQLGAVAVVVALGIPRRRRGSRSASSPSRPRPGAPAASAPPRAGAPRRRSTSSRARGCRRPRGCRRGAACCGSRPSRSPRGRSRRAPDEQPVGLLGALLRQQVVAPCGSRAGRSPRSRRSRRCRSSA